MNVTEPYCRCNGTGVIPHGGTPRDPDSLEICDCHAPGTAVRALCHALRHLSPTPELKARGRCRRLFAGEADR